MSWEWLEAWGLCKWEKGEGTVLGEKPENEAVTGELAEAMQGWRRRGHAGCMGEVDKLLVGLEHSLVVGLG